MNGNRSYELLYAEYRDRWIEYHAQERRKFRNRSVVPDKMWYARICDLDYCLDAFALAHFGFDPSENLGELAPAAVAIAVDYFSGPYLAEYPEAAENMTPTSDGFFWSEVFRMGTFFALLCEDTSSLDKICSWIESDFPEDDDVDFNKYDHKYWKALAMHLSKRDARPLGDEVLNGRSARARQLWNAVIAIDDRDEQGLGKHLHAYLKRYRQSLDLHAVGSCISLDASSVWLLAERSGMELPAMSEEAQALLLTPQSTGLSH